MNNGQNGSSPILSTIQPVTIDIMLNNNEPVFFKLFNFYLNLVCFLSWFASAGPCLLPTSTEVWGRVIFSQVSVTLSIGVVVGFPAGHMTRRSPSRGSPSKGGLHPGGWADSLSSVYGWGGAGVGQITLKIRGILSTRGRMHPTGMHSCFQERTYHFFLDVTTFQ